MKYIGIDPGKETGFAVWDHDAKYLAEVDTMSITQAMEKVRMMADILGRENIRLYIEDAGKGRGSGTADPRSGRVPGASAGTARSGMTSAASWASSIA